MIGSAIKFETFAIDPAGHGHARHTAEDLARARNEGFRAGEQAGRSEDVAAMTHAIDTLSRSLADDSVRAAACRAETVAALAPVLDAIVDIFAEAGPARRMREDLQAELARLAGGTLVAPLAIAGPAALQEMVLAIASQVGLERMTYTPTSDKAGITLTPGTGRIEFSQDRAVAEIRRLIAELQEEAP
ncbi:hypothetical protein MLD63_11500 [Paracoccus sp. TK19116]|uniref:Flagellar assembly protein FliH/Type III secretion system HrpE domain-containing protein n=1 Tax=Paracoccus albicereus TaxID=2922394 RepID=A0ABT1MRV2_9RHOB|nr:hypothetical protein [Paracoccus albicereus]MCQ0971047.1 hypothetical protein [Paracoccus albicereus]